MFSIKAQYFLTFAVMGSLLPFLPVYLTQRGLSLVQIGYVGASASMAVWVTPVIATLLADGIISGRRLLSVIFLISGGTLTAMYFAEGFWPILIFFSLYGLTFSATTSLQDGLNFHIQSLRSANNLEPIGYHRVRVWGTVGFIVPSLLLFGLLRQGFTIRWIIVSAIGFCVLGWFNSLWLPHLLIDREDRPSQHPPTPRKEANRLPTIQAAKAMLEPHVLVFCLAMLLLQMATAGYYSFYPIYLKNSVGLDSQWLGVTATLGVAIEIFYMLGFGRMLKTWGMKKLMVIGALSMVARFALLSASSEVVIAVGTQVLHGMMVLIVHVAPPIFLNHHAKNTYRNSMQGLYVMMVYGTGRLLGNILAGHLAAIHLPSVFVCGAVLSGLAVALFLFAFHEKKRVA